MGRHWTKKELMDCAKQYKTKMELHRENQACYMQLYRRDMLDLCDWFEDGNKIAADNRTKWTREMCENEAARFETRTEYARSSPASYAAALKNNWIDDFSFKNGNTEAAIKRTKWTVDTITEAAKNCSTKTEFARKFPSAYKQSLKNDGELLNTFIWFENGNKIAANKRSLKLKDDKSPKENKKKNRYWTYERCIETSKKYTTKKDFRLNEPSCYEISRRENYLEDMTWLFSDANKPSHYNHWTIESCVDEMSKYNSINDFRINNNSCYKFALKHELINDHFERESKPKGYWNYDRCKELSEQCESRGDFANKFNVQYNISRKSGWLDEFFPKN